MARYQKRQQEQKSCGAATLLVTLKELKGAPETTNVEEDKIYQAVKIPSGLGEGETLPSSIYSYARGQGLNAEIIESPGTAAAFGTKDMYKLYRGMILAGSLTPHLKSRDIADSDLGTDGHLFLVVKFDTSDLTHYVLARKDGGKTFIMNPDPGSDEEMPLPALSDPISTNAKGVYVQTGTGAKVDGTKRSYVYTGIAVRAWP